jgi:hypothetical protein
MIFPETSEQPSTSATEDEIPFTLDQFMDDEPPDHEKSDEAVSKVKVT